MSHKSSPIGEHANWSKPVEESRRQHVIVTPLLIIPQTRHASPIHRKSTMPIAAQSPPQAEFQLLISVNSCGQTLGQIKNRRRSRHFFPYNPLHRNGAHLRGTFHK